MGEAHKEARSEESLKDICSQEKLPFRRLEIFVNRWVENICNRLPVDPDLFTIPDLVFTVRQAVQRGCLPHRLLNGIGMPPRDWGHIDNACEEYGTLCGL